MLYWKNFLEVIKHYCSIRGDNFNRIIGSSKPLLGKRRTKDFELVATLELERYNPKYARWIKNCILKENRKESANIKKNDKTIAIILESPHIEEFQCERNDSYGDLIAAGKTGKHLNDFFLNFINRYVPTDDSLFMSKYDSVNELSNGLYNLYLVNLVPFQCSLGKPTNFYRDEILKLCVDETLKINDKFVNNFKSIISNLNPDIILNACTKEFKQTVWKLIDSLNLKCAEIESAHPSMWNKYDSLIIRKNDHNLINYEMPFKNSKYNIYFSNKNENHIFNTRSGSLIKLEKEKFDSLIKNVFSLFSEDEFKSLKDNNIITNETDEFLSVQKDNYNKSHNSKTFGITILPTLKCNAKCSYCFEAGANYECFMNDEIANKVIDYIKKNHNGRFVHITWFGGEPLLGIKTISYICNSLSHCNINYYSTMISNGYLVDKYIDVLKSKSINMKKIQITLDGLFTEYDQIKGLGENAFSKIISNIHLLLDNDIKVSIRINFDSENYKKTLDIVDFLYKEFGNDINVYFHDIIGEKYKTPFEVPINPFLEIFKKLIKYKYVNNLADMKMKRTYRPCGLYADDFIIVNPNGDITKCEHYVGKKSDFNRGNICDKTSNTIFEVPIKEECKQCICYPICGGGCYSNHLMRKNCGCSRIKNILSKVLELYMEREENNVGERN